MKSALFSPLALRDLLLENRVAVSPMCQYSAVDGNATDWHLMHLGQYSVSGAGLVIAEATAVESRGRISYGDLGLYTDENEQTLERVVRFFREYGSAKIGIQLAHAGRKASDNISWKGKNRPLSIGDGAWQTVAPSAIRFDENWPVPRALDPDGIKEIKAAFVSAARRAARAGFDLVELHAAHGYLLHQFLSPLSNRRTDAYGGSLTNRMRFPLEVFAAVREAWPAKRPMGVRISATDYADGGWGITDSLVLASELKKLGCDYIDVSGGGLVPNQLVEAAPGYQVKFAEAIKKDAGIPVMAVGMIIKPQQAEDVIASGKADIVAIARGMLDDPRWAWHAAHELGAEIKYPPQYLRCSPLMWPQGFKK
jgi:2,4-dienoyl-CoA reductase-like NADH-dependent reductase (Old Yellow Enzyme family)